MSSRLVEAHANFERRWCPVTRKAVAKQRSEIARLLEMSEAVVIAGGHNWENWRDRLREGLSWLFPGPLWMVYE